MPNTIMHFEIPADDVDRAKAFYEKIFGWTIKPFPMPPGQEYFGVTTHEKGEPGIDGGMMKRNMPGQPFTNYITVKSIDAMNRTIQANGGAIVLPKQEIGQGMGWISAFTDTENNLMGLHEAPAATPQTRAPESAAAGKGSARAPRAMTKAPKKASKKAPKKAPKVTRKAIRKRR
jgi:predicted enzyme related to lactoylglutathione lyase